MTLPRILRNSLAALALGLATSCAPAYAAACKDRTEALEELQEYKAHLVGMGVTESGTLTQVWVFPDNSWVIMIDTGELFCLGGGGPFWQTFPTGEAT